MDIPGFSRGTWFIIHTVLIIKPEEFSLHSVLCAGHRKLTCKSLYVRRRPEHLSNHFDLLIHKHEKVALFPTLSIAAVLLAYQSA